jgi:hypothetical protein
MKFHALDSAVGAVRDSEGKPAQRITEAALDGPLAYRALGVVEGHLNVVLVIGFAAHRPRAGLSSGCTKHVQPTPTIGGR